MDFTNQTVSVAQAPTASGQVATKGYVDNAVTSSVVSNSMPRMITAETAGTYTLGQAMRYCENLSATCQKEWSPGVSGTTNLTWTDNCSTTYSDWRLPTVGELVQFSNNSTYGFYSGITDDSFLWTATPYDSANGSWDYLRLSDADWSSYGYSGNSYVRCVR